MKQPVLNWKLSAFLPLVERGARDERNFVKKGVSWAPRWVGKEALRELTSPKVRSALARRARVDPARGRSTSI